MRDEELFEVRPFLPEETFLLVTSLGHGAYALVWGYPSTAQCSPTPLQRDHYLPNPTSSHQVFAFRNVTVRVKSVSQRQPWDFPPRLLIHWALCCTGAEILCWCMDDLGHT